MIKHKEVTETKTEKIATSVICDICKKEYSLSEERGNVDILETQEFHYVRFTGGYGSVFGDCNEIECDICQHCLKELIGKYCREKTDN